MFCRKTKGFWADKQHKKAKDKEGDKT